MSLITHIQTVIRPQLTLSIQVAALLLLASCGGGGGSSEPVNSPASSSTTPSGNTGSTGSNNQTTNTTNTETGSSGNDQDNDQSQTSNADASTLFETDSEMNIRLQAAQQTDQAASGQQSFMSPTSNLFWLWETGSMSPTRHRALWMLSMRKKVLLWIHPGRTRTHCASAEA